MWPRPSGSGTSRKRPWPRASVSSGWPHSTQRRGGRLEGGKGTETSLLPLPPPRDFSAAQLLALAAGAAGALLDVLDALVLEDDASLVLAALVPLEDDALVLELAVDEPPSLLVEP